MKNKILPLFLLISLISQIGGAKTLNVPEGFPSLSKALLNAQAGDVVMVSPGKYFERIKIPAGVTLQSVGNDKKGKIGLRRAEVVILDGKGDVSQIAGIELGEGSVVDGVTVTGMGSYDDKLWKEHNQSQGMNQSYDQIGGYNAPAIGGNEVNGIIRNCIVHHNGSTGIAVNAGSKTAMVEVSSNICFRNMGGGIGFMGGARGKVENNHCYENFYAGIGMEGGHPIVISNDCHHNIRAGIGISEGSCPIVKNNLCYKNRRAGIGVRTGEDTRPVLVGNNCYDNDMTGIGVTDQAYALIQKNHCHGNKLTGIGLQKGASATIIGNECNSNKAAGIGHRDARYSLMINNRIHHNGRSGIGFEKTESSESICLSNHIHDNAMVAVGVHEGWSVKMSGNKISRVGGMPPLVMIFEGAKLELNDNQMDGGGVASVRCAGSLLAEGNDVKGERTTGRPGPSIGIWGLPGSKISIDGNEFNGWQKVVVASECEVSVTNNRGSFKGSSPFQITKTTRPLRLLNNQFSGH